MTNPNHTDTSRSGDLVERLRRTYPDYYNPARASTGMAISPASLLLVRERLFNPDGLEAADLIETQAREIERLREALQSVVNACDQGKLAPLGGPCGMTIEAQIKGSVYNRVPAWPVEEARAALAGDSHDQ